MIGFIGDIHGMPGVLREVLKKIEEHNKMCDDYTTPEKKITVVVQVGDMGWYVDRIAGFVRVAAESSIPIYFIDGNHEDFLLLQMEEVTEMGKNLFFVPRGTVLELDGRTVALIGGAGSVDKAYNKSWSSLENITLPQLKKLGGVKPDILVTHVPPQSMIAKHFDPMMLTQYFGLPDTWIDINALHIEKLWGQMGYPPVISGHMHLSVVDGNARILNIAELYAM
jgi:UDP-2,3-diacylglucosamine pyrophosphatase LpxH